MRKLTMFNFITLNGFFKGTGGDISWHRHDGSENDFAASMLQSGNLLLFGRVTYEMMANYWPTPDAIRNNPVVAAGMNKAHKIVFSTTLKKAAWGNTTLIKENIIETIKNMKQSAGKGLTILGSGTIVNQFAEHGLIDEYELLLDPLAIGKGTPIFHHIKHPLELKLIATKTLKSGMVLLSYSSKQ